MVTHTRLLYFVSLLMVISSACADPQSMTPPSNGDTTLRPAPDAPFAPAPPYPQADAAATAGRGEAADIGPDAVGPNAPDSTDTHEPGADSEDVLVPSDSDAAEDGADAVAPQWPVRSCTQVFTYTPESPPATVHLATSYLSWADGALPMTADADGRYHVTLDMAGVPAGPYGYKFIVDLGLESEVWLLDTANMMRRFDDGFVNSKLRVPECRAPELVVTERDIAQDGQSATIVVTALAGIDTSVAPQSFVVTHNFAPLTAALDPDAGTLTVALTDLPLGKHTLRFEASAEAGLEAVPLAVSFWQEPTPFEWRDAALYFAFTDRFRDGDASSAPDPCLPADSIANWLGGDWAGVTDAIEEGYFEGLGINALWLNAPMDNPDGCVAGLHERQYTAFHGYFPADLSTTEARFGTLEDLRGLVSAAHARSIRVLIDLPANHLFETAPEWSEHGEAWFNDDGVCRDLDWATPETCWFEPYLPDLNHRNDAVVEYMSEVALKWAIDADLDGFRVDAVKHMHPHFLNTLRAKLNTRIEAQSDQRFWTVGETFTGGWQSGGGSEAELVKAYVSDDQLVGQFDFPLFWPLREAFADRSAPLTWLAEAALGGAEFYGPGAIMASFLGNHDVSRFITVAHGDNLESCPDGSQVVPWDCPPLQPEAAEPYARLLHAFTFLAAYTAVPLIYYGDEVGLAGAGDPDNRRFMPWGALNPRQEVLRESVSALFQARLGNLALRRGAFTVLSATEDTLVIERSLGDSRAFAVFNLAAAALDLSLPEVGELSLTNALDGATMQSADGALSWSTPAETVALWTTVP